jgi:hypothetical protein
MYVQVDRPPEERTRDYRYDRLDSLKRPHRDSWSRTEHILRRKQMEHFLWLVYVRTEPV